MNWSTVSSSKNYIYCSFNFLGDVSLLDTIPFNYRERHPRLFDMSLTSKKSIYQMQQTNPSILLEPGVDDDLIVFGRAKCNTDDDRFYDPQCYSYEGKKGFTKFPITNSKSQVPNFLLFGTRLGGGVTAEL